MLQVGHQAYAQWDWSEPAKKCMLDSKIIITCFSLMREMYL